MSSWPIYHSSEYNEAVTTKDTKTIDAFLTNVIHARMGMAYTGKGINVMTQALCAKDRSLPQGLDGTEHLY